MMIRVTLLLFLFLCSFNSISSDKDEPPVNVLFIGNSYTHMNNMPGIFEKIAHSEGVRVNAEMSAKSSHTFKMHSKREELFETIRSKKWDFIILQGFSRELAECPEYIDTASVPYLEIILDSINHYNASTEVLLFMTWGYKNGFAEREELSTNKSMSDSIRSGYEYVSKLFDLSMVPVGPVWSDFQSSNTKIDLYYKDLAHPSYCGSYITACSFYSAIFKKCAHKAYSGRLRKRIARVLQKSSYNYIVSNLETFKLDRINRYKK